MGDPNDDEDKIVGRWISDYIDNNMTWVKPVTNLTLWNSDARKKERGELEKMIKDSLESYDQEIIFFENAMKNHVVPKRDFVLAVVAAGNSGIEMSKDDNAGFLQSKSMTEDDPIIGVASGCGANHKQLCSSSNHGNTVVDILAPGEHIPVIFTLKSNDGKVTPKVTYVSGTSYSSPLVTGIAALLARCKPTASVKDIKDAILKNAARDHNLSSKIRDGKVLDVKKTIDYMCKSSAAPISEQLDNTDL